MKFQSSPVPAGRCNKPKSSTSATADRRDRVTRDMNPVGLYRCAYRTRLQNSYLTEGMERTVGYLEARAGEISVQHGRRRAAAKRVRRYIRGLVSLAPSVGAAAIIATVVYACAWLLMAALGGPAR